MDNAEDPIAPVDPEWEDAMDAALDPETRARVWEDERSAMPVHRVDVAAGMSTDATGETRVPVRTVEGLLRLMTPDELLDYAAEHEDWQSVRDANGHVTFVHRTEPPTP
jgi:hypothetical protein